MLLVGPQTTRETDALVTPRDLGERYRAYCRTQASRLVRMLPREAIRPLYRRAREVMGEGDAEDPLALLVRYCQQLLPLPPFEVWREDLRRHPDAYLRDLDESPDPPTADAPSTVEVRTMEFDGRAWRACLRSFRDQGVWRGFIAFEEQGAPRGHRTTAIFCESDPTELRERFLSFAPATLEAFLRSSLP